MNAKWISWLAIMMVAAIANTSTVLGFTLKTL